MTDHDTFASALERLRTSRGLSPAQLARELDEYEGNVSRWRHGKPIDLLKVRKVADFFGVKRGWLEELAGYPPEDQADASVTPLDPQLAALVATVESGWRAMDSAARDVAERGTRAMWATTDNRHSDGSANRHTDRRRNLDRRNGQQGEIGSDERLSDGNHSVKRLVVNSLAVLRTLVQPANRMAVELAR